LSRGTACNRNGRGDTGVFKGEKKGAGLQASYRSSIEWVKNGVLHRERGATGDDWRGKRSGLHCDRVWSGNVRRRNKNKEEGKREKTCSG